MLSYRLSASVAALAFALGHAASAAAQTEPPGPAASDSIVVTGQLLREDVDAGKDDTPLIEIPQAISVVPAEQLKQRGVTRLADALLTVAGASRSSTYGFYDAYTLRGFDAAYGSLFLDGLINQAGGGGSNYEMYGLEAVEVVKGPAAALFGGGSLGGVINLVSKRPSLSENFAEASVSTGSYNLFEAAGDANVMLDKKGTFAARLVGVYRDSDSFVRFAGFNRVYFQPSLSWQIGPATTLTLNGTYKRDNDNPWGPLPAYGTVFPLADGSYLPRDFAVSNGGDQKPVQVENRKTIGYMFDHAFTDRLKVSQNLRYMHRTTFWDRWMFADNFIDDAVDAEGNLIPGTGRTLGRYYYGPYNETFKSLLVDNRVTGKVDTGLLRHNLMGGIDYRDTRSRYSGDGDYDPTHFPLDAFDPDYFAPLNPVSAPYSGYDTGEQLGFYVQDHVELRDAVTLTLNGRWDQAKFNGEPQNAFSPRVGVTWAIVPGVSLYGSWSRSFTPQFGSQVVKEVGGDGNPSVIGQAPPERGRIVEIGVKFDVPSAALSGMVSLYKLRRTNVLTGDPQFPQFSRVSGEQGSEGVEVELHWRPARGFGIDAAYSYIKSQYVEDSAYPTGMRLPNIPDHTGSVYAHYEVQDGPVRGLGANLGVAYTAERQTYDAFPYPGQDPLMLLQPYTLVSGGLSYTLFGWQVQVNGNNLLDKRYTPDACCLSRVTPGEPRNWRLTLRRRF